MYTPVRGFRTSSTDQMVRPEGHFTACSNCGSLPRNDINSGYDSDYFRTSTKLRRHFPPLMTPRTVPICLVVDAILNLVCVLIPPKSTQPAVAINLLLKSTSCLYSILLYSVHNVSVVEATWGLAFAHPRGTMRSGYRLRWKH